MVAGLEMRRSEVQNVREMKMLMGGDNVRMDL